MTPGQSMPINRDTDWDEVPEDWDADGRLYDGVRGRRVVAYLIDLAIVGLLIFALWAVAIGPVVLSFGLLKPVLLLATAALPLAYATWCIGGPWQATVGMRMMDLRVVDVDGGQVNYLQAAMQTVIFMASVAVTQFLILLFSFFNDQSRCLHDYLAGTVVVNRWALDRQFSH